MRKCANISPYMRTRRLLVIYYFATAPFWISLHMKKIRFSFLLVQHPIPQLADPLIIYSKTTEPLFSSSVFSFMGRLLSTGPAALTRLLTAFIFTILWVSYLQYCNFLWRGGEFMYFSPATVSVVIDDFNAKTETWDGSEQLFTPTSCFVHRVDAKRLRI